MAKEIHVDSEKQRIFNFEGLVTLTLTSDWVITYMSYRHASLITLPTHQIALKLEKKPVAVLGWGPGAQPPANLAQAPKFLTGSRGVLGV